MDEQKIKAALNTLNIPEPDENARKRAVNLAMAEYEAAQKKNQKSFQGFPFLSRLMGTNNPNKGRNTMEHKQKKRLVYGGMATAMAVVLIAGVSLTQMQSGIFEVQETGLSAELSAAKGAQFDAVDTSAMDTSAVEERAVMGLADTAASGAIPIPTTPPIGRLELAPAQKSARTTHEIPQNLSVQSAPAIAGAPAMQNLMATSNRIIAPMPMPAPDMPPAYYQDQGRDQFESSDINPIKLVTEEPVSTFSVDVDTASYAFMRRQINSGRLPSADSIRIEELINYFDYNYALPESKDVPFKPSVTITPSPWAAGKELVHIGIKGYEIEQTRPQTNLVFLLDTSGSMNAPDKLPLLKNALKLLLDTLQPDDTVAIASYAGMAGTVLEPTKITDKAKIITALDGLQASGGTAGGAGIELAYNLAQQNFDSDAVNRIILATDGDFNVGIHDPEALKDYITKKRDSGIYLSVLGFGQGNYNDHIMQSLAQNGNGIAAYIDTLSEARKVLVEEASSILFPIASDVKIQVEFNPAMVSEYRLVGYETRALAREDFNNDKVDAGDIGAGHTVTAIYEITPKGSGANSIDDLRYGTANKTETSTTQTTAQTDFGDEYAFLKMRYKLPGETESKLITTPITSAMKTTPDADTKFATAVAGFGQILKGGKYTGTFGYDDVIDLALQGKGADEFGYRAEFINLVRLAKSLNGSVVRSQDGNQQ